MFFSHWIPPQGDREESFDQKMVKQANDICTAAERKGSIPDSDINILRRTYNLLDRCTKERIDLLSSATNKSYVWRLDDGDGRFNDKGDRFEVRTEGSAPSSAWRLW
jgi:hypothetical protein